MDVTYFPFDNQHCEIRIGSWIYDVRQLDLVHERAGVELDEYVENKEYEILDIRTEREVHDEAYDMTMFNK